MTFDVAYYLSFSVTMLCMVLLLRHTWGVLQNIREEKRMLASFLAPFILFMPGLLTEKGNYHRTRIGWFLIWLLVFLTLCIFLDRHRRGEF
jgi:hypothetical protein